MVNKMKKQKILLPYYKNKTSIKPDSKISNSGTNQTHASTNPPDIIRTASQDIQLTPENILYLQRTVGNQAVTSLIQAKLKIGQPGDEYEQEADRVAERVLRMPESASESGTRFSHNSLSGSIPGVHPETKEVRRQESNEEEERKRQEEEPIHAKEQSGQTPAITDKTESHINSLRGSGEPLPNSERAWFEPRFGHDFSEVQVHKDAQAAESARAINAQAFTIGKDVVFGAGQYTPKTSKGKRLLAHELTHTIQQGHGTEIRTTKNHKDGYRSEALKIRNRLSTTPLARSVIQRKDGDKATTALGEYEAVKYHPIKRTSDNKEVGMEMFLKFHPGTNVDAKQIGLTQAAEGIQAGTQILTGIYGRRSATTGAGQGYFIDVLPNYPSPLYATKSIPRSGSDPTKLRSYDVVPSTALSSAQSSALSTATGLTGITRRGFGKHGYRYMDKGRLKGPVAAELYDAPRLPLANNSEQVFETTALAMEGAQEGTYYGSVQWGWRRDGSGNFSEVAFTALSQGVPTVNFLTAASIWNNATEDYNWGASASPTDVLDTSLSVIAVIAQGTALESLGRSGRSGPNTYNFVRIKDGPSTGTTGWVLSTEMAIMDVGRATVDLPVMDVHYTNTAGVSLVRNPSHYDKTILHKLPNNTRLQITDNGAGERFNRTTDRYKWWKVIVVDGPHTSATGWVMQRFLTQEVRGTR